MRSLIGRFGLFVAGVGVGILLMQPGAAQTTPGPGLRLSHVGVFAKNYDESLRFYTNVMGLREAFTVRDKDGKPTLTYLQISKEAFLELSPANGRPVGLSHVGIWPVNLDATVAALRQRGITVGDPRAGTTRITNATDPDGIRLELLDFLPDSEPRKAMDSWK